MKNTTIPEPGTQAWYKAIDKALLSPNFKINVAKEPPQNDFVRKQNGTLDYYKGKPYKQFTDQEFTRIKNARAYLIQKLNLNLSV